MKPFVVRVCRALLYASLFGSLIGLTEGVADVWFGAAMTSAWLPTGFSTAPTTKFLYVLFVTALYALLLQAVMLIASHAALLLKKGDAPSPYRDALPHWALLSAVMALTMFAGLSESLFTETEFLPLGGITAMYVVFLLLCIWQVRMFFRHISAGAAQDPAQTLIRQEARVGAYVLLLFLALIAPDLSNALKSPLARGVALASVVVLVFPLSAVLETGLGLFYRCLGGREGRGGRLAVSTTIAILLPLTAVSVLWRLPTEESVLSSHPWKASSAQRKDGPNVIILLVDMLRADHMGCYGYHRNTTSNIDRLASEGVLFRNALSEASWTLPSTVTLLTGLQPSVHGAKHSHSALSDEVDTMAEIFSRNGYSTAAFVANPYLKKAFNVSQGFDEYDDDFISHTYFDSARKSAAVLAKTILGLENLKLLFSRKDYDAFNTEYAEDREVRWWSEKMDIGHVNARALDWVRDNRDHPFFLYLHYIDIHGPYIPPRPFVEDGARSELEQAINLYDGALRYVDSQIDLFVRRLDQLGIRDNSIIIITSDHGEEFKEHGKLGHGHNLFEEEVRVPLIFLGTPAFPFRAIIHEPVGLVDLLPTMTDYLDLQVPASPTDGSSFADSFSMGAWTTAPEYRYSETELYVLHRSVRYQNRWKLVQKVKSGMREEQLFDLTHDPRERVNLSREQPEIAALLRHKLDERFADFQDRALSAQTFEPDERTRRLIKALGYVQ